jgi:hypothetical protein
MKPSGFSTQDSLQTQDPLQQTASLSEPTLCRYFATFNAQDFQATAGLFAPMGILYPPFELAIVGQDAIAQYLKKEAKGMRAFPLQETAHPLEDGNTEYRVVGKVLTSLFGVNVAWQFMLNPQSEILSMRLKLLAALEDLLNLKR